MNRWQDAALAMLVVVAGVMMFMALRPADVASSDAGLLVPDDESSATAAPTADATVPPTDEETETGATGVPGSWLVGLAKGSLVIRAPAGECVPGSTPVNLAAAPDGGNVFQETEVPDLLAVTGLHVDGEQKARVVGAGPDCSVVSFATADGGRSWRSSPGVAAIWSLLPGGPRQIASPGGMVDQPCRPRGVSGIDDTVARVWCTDGRILGTASGGDDWVTLGRLSDATAMAFQTPGDGFALTAEPGCAGTGVSVTRDGGTSWTSVHCATVSGPWGLATDKDTVMVVGSDGVEASSDFGVTWNRG